MTLKKNSYNVYNCKWLYKCDSEKTRQISFLKALPSQHHIVSKSSSVWPPRGSLTPQPLQRGMGVCVSVCVCLYLGKCLLTCMNMLLYLMCIDRPVTSHFFDLFVCLFFADTFTMVILYPADFGIEAHHLHFLPHRQLYMYWVRIRIRQRSGQCKCKHKPTNQNKRAQYGSFLSFPAPLHLLCLPSLLTEVAIRSYNDCISFPP